MSDGSSSRIQTSEASVGATAILVFGLIVTTVISSGEVASELATEYAFGVGLSFVLSLLADYRRNVRNLVRADIMALSSLYFLTLAEFLVPQPAFDFQTTLEEVKPALTAVIAGFASLAIGRHLAPAAPVSMLRLTQLTPPRGVLIGLFTACFVGGYFNMLVAVNYDFGLMLDYFMAPRFAQPWGRGRFGDWRALLYEIGMVLYLVPPIAGVVLAERKKYTKVQLIYVGAGLAFTFFYGFTSGTRNIFATYLATFLVAYAFTAGRQRRAEILVVAGLGCAAMLYATTAMLEFRRVGFSNYIRGVTEYGTETGDTPFFVDNNLNIIAKLIQIFPSRHEYLGFEIPYLALVRPIPRALWPDKPEGMSMSIEKALDVGESFTLAATFIGEAHMSGGLVGIVLCGAFFGAIMGWWNRLGSENNSPFGYLIYASGFFAAVISMRSLLVFTTAILPTVAAIVFGHWLVYAGLARRRQRATESEHE